MTFPDAPGAFQSVLTGSARRHCPVADPVTVLSSRDPDRAIAVWSHVVDPMNGFVGPLEHVTVRGRPGTLYSPDATAVSWTDAEGVESPSVLELTVDTAHESPMVSASWIQPGTYGELVSVGDIPALYFMQTYEDGSTHSAVQWQREGLYHRVNRFGAPIARQELPALAERVVHVSPDDPRVAAEAAIPRSQWVTVPEG